MGYNYHLDMGVDPTDGDTPELSIYTVVFEYPKKVFNIGSNGVTSGKQPTAILLMNATDFDAVVTYVESGYGDILEEHNVKEGRILVYLAVFCMECISKPVLAHEYRIIDGRLFEEVI